MNNIITMSNDDLVGYYNDLKIEFADNLKIALDDDDGEAFEELSENFSELVKYKDSNKLLRLSHNNCMGFTITELDVE